MIRRLLIQSALSLLGIFLVSGHAHAQSIENVTNDFASSDVQEISVSDNTSYASFVDQQIDQVATTTHANLFENIFNNGFTHSSSDDTTPVSEPQQPAATLPQTSGNGSGGSTIITSDPGHLFATAIAPLIPNTKGNVTFIATILAFLVFYAGFGLRSYTGSSPPYKISFS